MANQSMLVMPFSCIAIAAPRAIQRAGLSDGMPRGSSGWMSVSRLTFSTYAFELFSLGGAHLLTMALLPAAKMGLLKKDVAVNAITGSTGAGQKPGATTHFSWRMGNLSIYKVMS